MSQSAARSSTGGSEPTIVATPNNAVRSRNVACKRSEFRNHVCTRACNQKQEGARVEIGETTRTVIRSQQDGEGHDGPRRRTRDKSDQIDKRIEGLC